MYQIHVPEKTGYTVTNVTTPVIIRDSNGMLFYSTESLVPKVKEFNLPGFGTYMVESGSFRKAAKPVDFGLLWLPPAEHNLPPAKDFPVVWEKTDDKANIDFGKRQIIFDESFRERTLPEKYFLYYHELSHRRYKTEKWCDIMADNYMRIKGFNPSQIGYAHISTLSERQAHRKRFHINRIIEQNLKA